MSAKLTTQDFIDRARAVHGDKYGYAFSVYQSSREKVMIHCPEHGIFEQKANNHLNGRGCRYCFAVKSLTTSDFITKANIVHGNKYNYSSVEYKTTNDNVVIICKKHGEFIQSPKSHLRGSDCPKCASIKISKIKLRDSFSFIKKARELHGDKYDYSFVSYTHSQNKVSIICHKHGTLLQTPNQHLNGRGCPGCAEYGFDRTKVGFLYVLRSDCGRYMKIGITNKPNQRQAQLSRATPFSFKRIELIEGLGEQIANLEKELLAEYQQVEFTEVFDGSTEWRLWSDSIRGYFV